MKFGTKFANLIASMLTLISLAGCSDTPSDGDVRRAIRSMTGDCQYFDITNILKVNWALPGTTDYQVDMQYSILITPLPDAETVTAALATPLTALNAHLAAAGIERDRNFKANADFLDHIERAQVAGDETMARSYESQQAEFVAQKLEPSTALARELAAQKAGIIKQGTLPLRNEFFKECPKTTAAVYDQIYGNADVPQFVGSHTMDFATTIRMTKADHGWEIKK